jgi:hypothetical protein
VVVILRNSQAGCCCADSVCRWEVAFVNCRADPIEVPGSRGIDDGLHEL